MDNNTLIVFVTLIGGLTISQIVDSLARAWGQRTGARHKHDGD